MQESTAPVRKARAHYRAIRRLAVRGQHDLDRQVEQRTDPSKGWFVLSSRTSYGRALVELDLPTMLCDRQDFA